MPNMSGSPFEGLHIRWYIKGTPTTSHSPVERGPQLSTFPKVKGIPYHVPWTKVRFLVKGLPLAKDPPCVLQGSFPSEVGNPLIRTL